MKNLIFCIVILISTQLSFARTDCPVAKVQYIQIEGTRILYLQENSPWRTLGYIDHNDGTKERYSALLSAQMSGKKVMVAYSRNGYDCTKTNYSESAYVVRIYPK